MDKTENFIEKAKLVHGDNYDYSKVEYKTSTDKVCIICKKHGEFYQTPHNHLSKHGCPICAREKSGNNQKKSLKEIIESFKSVHGDRYDYSKVDYKGINTRVTIICKEHGEFLQIPKYHINGHGCPYCGGRKKLTTEEFISKAKVVHGDKYNYSNVNYETTDKEVEIICKKHGSFMQRPHEHLCGSNCPLCAQESRTKKQTYRKEDFVNKSKLVHGDKYDYSKTIYKFSWDKVIITCPIHGNFEQTASIHMNGYGCPKCGSDSCADKFKKTTEQFIKEATAKHGDLYDYSKVEYKNKITKIPIICKKHGIFWQTPSHHLDGEGCPICQNSKLENEIKNFLTNINIEFEEQKKFDWLVNKQPLSLDFYMPKYNVAIECQGKQHFGFGGWKDDFDFEVVKERDLLKKDLCDKHGVKLLYYSNLGIDYPYEVIEDKEKLLESIIKNH